MSEMGRRMAWVTMVAVGGLGVGAVYLLDGMTPQKAEQAAVAVPASTPAAAGAVQRGGQPPPAVVGPAGRAGVPLATPAQPHGGAPGPVPAALATAPPAPVQAKAPAGAEGRPDGIYRWTGEAGEVVFGDQDEAPDNAVPVAIDGNANLIQGIEAGERRATVAAIPPSPARPEAAEGREGVEVHQRICEELRKQLGDRLPQVAGQYQGLLDGCGGERR